MENAMDVIKLIAELSIPLATILVALLTWKQKGKIDLDKTMEAAKDALGIVQRALKENASEGEALNKGVKEIEHIRGHRISKKLQRKAKARLESLLRQSKGQ